MQLGEKVDLELSQIELKIPEKSVNSKFDNRVSKQEKYEMLQM